MRFLSLLLLLASLSVAQPRSDSYGTPGTYTWTVPAGVTSIQVECWGSGGHGGNGGSTHTETYTGEGWFLTGSYTDQPGGGGGGGAYSVRYALAVSPGQTFSVTVPVGGSVQPTVFGANVCKAASGMSGGSGDGPSLDHWEAYGSYPNMSIEPVFSDSGSPGGPGPAGTSANSVGDYTLSGADGDGGSSGKGGNAANGGLGGRQSPNNTQNGGSPGAGGAGGYYGNNIAGVGNPGQIVIAYTVRLAPKLIVVDQ